jgi:hypothetical protein
MFIETASSAISSAPSPVEKAGMEVIPAIRNNDRPTRLTTLDFIKIPVNKTKHPKIKPMIGKWLITKCKCASFITFIFYNVQ